MDFLVLFILIFTNGRIARRKGRNVFGWSALTFAAFIIVETICGVIYVAATYKGAMTPQAVRDYMLQIQQQPIKVVTLLLFGVGGGLLIRFILEKMPAVSVNRDSFPNDGNRS